MNEVREDYQRPTGENRGEAVPSLFLGALCERDIDLLIVESVYADSNLLRWLCHKMNIDAETIELLEARVSSFEASGESDIEFWVRVDSEKTIAILLENKINANFQPNQAERYIERGRAYISQGLCGEFRLGLVAPESYLSRASEALSFEHRISYEALLAWFTELPESRVASGTHFKITQLHRAIEKAREGYCRIEDAAVTDFWSKASALISSLVPELFSRMTINNSVGKPARSLWFRYRVPELGSQYFIIHKMNKGVLDLQLSGRARDEFALAPHFEPILPEGMSVARTSKSLALRVSVPVLMPNLPFEEQREALTTALLSTENLLKWIKTNRANLQKVLGREDSLQEFS